MARKVGIYGVLAYLIYGLFIYWYLFYFSSSALPFEYEGTAADPATFLNSRELMLSEEYSKIRNLLFFLSTPFEWLVYLFVLITGLSRIFSKWADETAKFKWLKTPIYAFWLSLFAFLITLPLQYVSYSISKAYNISTQSFPSWMKDELIDFWLNFGSMAIMAAAIYWLIKRSRKRWWFYFWLLSVPFTLFIMFIRPVIIDPLYNDFYPLKDKQLEEKILQLASKADIPTEHVFEVNMSEKTNALNAYVTGIGSNSRIVLWDTTLTRLDDDEILFIMAHEMAHYVEKHLYIGIGGYLLLSLAGLYLISRLMNAMIAKWGNVFKVQGVGHISSFPLFLMLLSMFLFASSPLSNLVSRYQETRADRYAIELTENKEAGVRTFQELTKAGLSQVNPPLLVKIFRYGHPTMLERITMIEEYDLDR